jgi:hypothetical protein
MFVHKTKGFLPFFLFYFKSYYKASVILKKGGGINDKAWILMQNLSV